MDDVRQEQIVLAPTVRCKFCCQVLKAGGGYLQGATVTFRDITSNVELGSGTAGSTGFFQITPVGMEGSEFLRDYIFPTLPDQPPIFEVQADGRGYEGRVDNLTHQGTQSEPKPGGGTVEFEMFDATLTLPLEEKKDIIIT
jgi:hypothetical protein